MQKFSWSLARHDEDKTTSIPAVTDAVTSIASRVETSQAPAPRASETTAAATVATEAEAPALTRRELREREARAAAASRPKLFQAPPAAAARSRRSAAAPSIAAAPTVSATPAVAIAASAPRVAKAAPTVARSASKAAPKIKVVPSTAHRPVKTAGFKRRVLSNLVTVGAMTGVGLMLVSTTVPANAFVRPETSESAMMSSAASNGETQELEVNAAAAPAVARDGYTVVSPVKKVQAKVGKRTYDFVNNPTAAVQWPFPGGSPITSGFGPRQVAGCGFCSTNHLGLDFNPGFGVPIQSIADGVVSSVSVSNGGFGNSVVVDHVVNGQRVQSLYAHMQYGSIQVAVGQPIGVGDMIGAVGSTGNSTGAHLHLEIRLDGTPVDPYAWLQANAG